METPAPAAPAAPPIRPTAGLPAGAALGARIPGQAQPSCPRVWTLTSQRLAHPPGRLRSGSDAHCPRSPRQGSHSRSNSSASFSGTLAPPSGPAPEMSRRRIPYPTRVVGLRVGRSLASWVL